MVQMNQVIVGMEITVVEMILGNEMQNLGVIKL